MSHVGCLKMRILTGFGLSPSNDCAKLTIGLTSMRSQSIVPLSKLTWNY